jgi:hypothetical protein
VLPKAPVVTIGLPLESVHFVISFFHLLFGLNRCCQYRRRVVLLSRDWCPDLVGKISPQIPGSDADENGFSRSILAHPRSIYSTTSVVLPTSQVVDGKSACGRRADSAFRQMCLRRFERMVDEAVEQDIRCPSRGIASRCILNFIARMKPTPDHFPRRWSGERREHEIWIVF